MTAHALKGDEERCIHGGMDRYISKPIPSAELFAAIGSLPGADGPDQQLLAERESEARPVY